MIQQLVYVSRAITGPRTEEEIEDILLTSRERNEENGVSGILLFRGTTFLQLLEGPAEAVRETLRRIERDPRHRDLAVLVDQPARERIYQDWSMGFHSLSDGDAHLVNELLGWSNLILRPEEITPAQIVDLIGRFRASEASAPAPSAK